MPNEALTPKSDTTSTESSNTCSPPDHRASSESSGVHSGEDTKEDVVIRARPVIAGPQKSIMKQPQPAIIEEPFGRPTNMSLSSFKDGQNCSTLPSRGGQESQSDYSQCNTMPLPVGAHHNNQHHRISANEPRQRTTLPNNIRYSAGQYLRQIPHIKNAENPYGYGLTGSGHHTFSKHIQNEIVGPNANIISSSQSQQQFVPHPVAQPMHNFQTTSSSFTTFNHPPQSPSMYNNCNNPPSYNADHHHGSNNVVYSSTHNSLQMH